MSNLINKAKAAISSNKNSNDNTQYDNPQSGNAGPHSSGMMNKLDPRVDSDRDGRNDPTSRTGGYGQTQDGLAGPGGNTPAGNVSSDNQYDDPRSTNAGPHSSNFVNKADPRVDSDMDHRNDPTSRVGGYGTGPTGATGGINNPGGYDAQPAGYGTGPAGATGGLNQPGAQYDDPRSMNAGPHSSNLMNKADPRVDSDMDNRNDPTSRVGGYGNTQTDTYGTAGGAGGLNNPTSQYDDPRSANSRPHSSNLANKVDPRVDSDRDGRNDPTSRVGGYGNTQTDSYGTAGPTGAAGGFNNSAAQYDDPRSANAGPHSSNLANKLDPRVDSDRDGRNDPTSRVGGYGETQTGYGSNTSYNAAATSQGFDQSSAQHDNPRSTNAGPHGSNLVNKVDPRVDSDRDGRNDPTSRVGGYGQTQTGPTGYDNRGPISGGVGGYNDGAPPSGNFATGQPVVAGDYGSNVTPGSGDAQKTAGPHNSNMLNKLDPRVDSDLDGSRTYGGNATAR